MDWKSILDKAIDIGGPIAGAAIDMEAPGVGTALKTGLPYLKNYVVDKYVPGEEAEPSPPAIAPPAMEAKASLSPDVMKSEDSKRAMDFLRDKGWSPADISLHMGKQAPQAPLPLSSQLVYGFFDESGKWQEAEPHNWEDAAHLITAAIKLGHLPYVWDEALLQWRPIALQPQHSAAVVHGVLAEAGYSTEQRKALLQGPNSAITNLKEEARNRPGATGKGHMEDIIYLRSPTTGKG